MFRKRLLCYAIFGQINRNFQHICLVCCFFPSSLSFFVWFTNFHRKQSLYLHTRKGKELFLHVCLENGTEKKKKSINNFHTIFVTLFIKLIMKSHEDFRLFSLCLSHVFFLMLYVMYKLTEKRKKIVIFGTSENFFHLDEKRQKEQKNFYYDLLQRFERLDDTMWGEWLWYGS